MASKIETLRLELMGIGTPESERTPAQRRLATIVLTTPIERSFLGRPDELELWRLQQRFLAQRHRYTTTKDERNLRPLAAAMLKTDRTLSRCATGYLAGARVVSIDYLLQDPAP